jgi:hypothetical protein
LTPTKAQRNGAVQVVIACHCAHCGSDAASDFVQTPGNGRRIDLILTKRQPEG